jgi:galactokinase
MESVIDQVVELFDQTFRSSASAAPCRPAGLGQAPGRVNLIGEHTDYNAGLVLPIALPQRTYAAVRSRHDRLVRLVSAGHSLVEIELDDIAPGRPDSWARYPAGVLWALEQAGYQLPGFDIAIVSQVPVGAGLSSSAAIEGAVAVAVAELCQLGLLADDAGRQQLAAYCQQAENQIALAPTGGMDQAASLRSQAGHALNLDCADGSVRQVPFDLDPVGLVLLVIDTKASHSLSDGQYGARRADCEQAAAELGLTSLRQVDPLALEAALAALSNDRLRRRVRHVVTEIQRVSQAIEVLTAGDFVALGRLFSASHQSLRDDYEVSCPELDTVQQLAERSGALGARMTGGGFGGSAIALLPVEQVPTAQRAIKQAFAEAGWSEPGFLAAVAAGPAGPVDARLAG